MNHPEKDAVIRGVGISQIGRRTGVSALDLTLQAVHAAIADAGLSASDIDGIDTLGVTPTGEVASALGIEPNYYGGGFGGTGGLLSPVMSACVAVGTGRARHVLVYRTVQMMGGTIDADASESKRSGSDPTMSDVRALLSAHAYSAANWLAMACQRHMALYGTTKEQLGWLAVNSRRNAGLNPLAVYRDPLSLEDYLAARVISTPFGLLDCDVPVDGSIALVISHRDSAADAPHPVVGVEAIGGAPGTGGWTQRPDYPRMAASDAAAQMWSATDLQPADIQTAQLYDGFTFLTLAWLEALGICGTGESGAFIEGAQRISRESDLPLNTYGGQLSAGRMHGYWVLHEACQQLRGRAGQHQLSTRPEVAVVSVGGGPIAGCMLLTC